MSKTSEFPHAGVRLLRLKDELPAAFARKDRIRRGSLTDKRGMPRKSAKSSSRRPRQPAVNLAQVRDAITSLDEQLVRLLNQRATLVVQVGDLKRAQGLPTYAPHREAQVLDRVLGLSKGPLPSRTLEAMYRELMSGSFTLQQPVRVGFLGPEGSYSHLATIKHFGSSVAMENLHDITSVFSEVARQHIDFGMAPIENTIGGGIVETLDAFRDLVLHEGKRDITICAEVQLAIRHALLCNGEPKAIKRIYSKPEVFTQCRHWLARSFPNAQLIPTPSSSKAAEMVRDLTAQAVHDAKPVDAAAIGSELAGRLYGLHPLFHGIEDVPGNVTRFVVLGRTPTPASGDDKTSLMFDLADKPGALAHVLQAFAAQKINLTHIEKRPSGRKNWTYTFLIDALGHRDDTSMAEALAEARHHCKDLVVLGSYPRSKRVL
jgi:chorismate mutase / prephenate dehydratase